MDDLEKKLDKMANVPRTKCTSQGKYSGFLTCVVPQKNKDNCKTLANFMLKIAKRDNPTAEKWWFDCDFDAQGSKLEVRVMNH